MAKCEYCGLDTFVMELSCIYFECHEVKHRYTTTCVNCIISGKLGQAHPDLMLFRHAQTHLKILNDMVEADVEKEN